MKKTLITTLTALILMIAAMPQPTFAASGHPLTDKKTYYTEESDYIPGDCILTATRMMIRRAAILNGRTEWKKITNASFRGHATVDGCLLSSFSYEHEGMKYDVGCGEFKGESTAARIEEFAELLKEHPEGVVVHGDSAASTGMHGVLLVKVENGVPYAMDATYNMGMFSKGIQKWSDTTMLDPSLCTRYWYITGMSGGGYNGIKTDSEGVTEDIGRFETDRGNPLTRLLDDTNINILSRDITCI